ncbi:citrate lyase subunit beta / citryl-CoA lyase [Natronorubrum sediminis]|uniref:Citrate lyase subunit beta / citryl-CoA lyase n=1 Tax=Natronorubrum sediminis TaxID=640943 RepID=A0A1H6G5D7_9EURY|nr:CoA ester lyase [Natronorubrum sediminis]SEH17802.1 citrate lyase subunit beta / citryl-CoA lyase [Natronorubrum sediminis]
MPSIARSTLFTPGDEPEMMRKAVDTEADAVTLDLEDSVAPASKPTAREEVCRFLDSAAREGSPRLGVRMNPLSAGGSDDLNAIIGGPRDPAYLVVPMVDRASDVRAVTAELDDRGSSVSVRASIETARGVLNAPEIASSPGVSGLGFGGEDLSAAVGATVTVGDELQYARQRIVMAAAAAGITTTDTVYIDIEDPEGLRETALTAKRLGYDGKSAIHPAQTSVINDVFTPTRAELEAAERIVEAFEESEGGVVRVDGQMIDRPVYEQARRTLDRGPNSNDSE